MDSSTDEDCINSCRKMTRSRGPSLCVMTSTLVAEREAQQLRSALLTFGLIFGMQSILHMRIIWDGIIELEAELRSTTGLYCLEVGINHLSGS